MKVTKFARKDGHEIGITLEEKEAKLLEEVLKSYVITASPIVEDGEFPMELLKKIQKNGGSHDSKNK